MLVQEDGKPVGVLTRQDLLAFLLALSGFTGCACSQARCRVARRPVTALE